MVSIQPLGLRWLSPDDPSELCVHAEVDFRIGDAVLLDASRGDFAVSAAALFLLRTLSTPHSAAAPIAERLFPHCGFALYDLSDDANVEIAGCEDGADFEIRHLESGEGVAVLTGSGSLEASWHDWRTAVFGFADQISAWFGSAAPRRPMDSDREGFRKMCAEWKRRRGRALGAG